LHCSASFIAWVLIASRALLATFYYVRSDWGIGCYVCLIGELVAKWVG